MDTWFPFLFPLLWLGVGVLTSLVLGIYGLYREFPQDKDDPIHGGNAWAQVGFGPLFFGGHAPMNLGFGIRCLHMKEPFPFQPLFWLGPASIPWDRIRIVDRISENPWALFSWVTLRIEGSGKTMRLSGRSGRAIQAVLDEKVGARGALTPRPIRPT